MMTGPDGFKEKGSWEGMSGYSQIGSAEVPVSVEVPSSGKFTERTDLSGEALSIPTQQVEEYDPERVFKLIRSSFPPDITDATKLPLIPRGDGVPADLAKTLPVAESPFAVRNGELTLDGLDDAAKWIVKNMCNRIADKGLFNLIVAQLNHTYGKDQVLMSVKKLLIGKTIRNIFNPFNGKPVEARVKFVIEGEISELICLVEIDGVQVEVDLWTILKLNPVAGIKPIENGSSQA